MFSHNKLYIHTNARVDMVRRLDSTQVVSTPTVFEFETEERIGETAVPNVSPTVSTVAPPSNVCTMCGKAFDYALSSHHTVPRAMGGDDGDIIKVCRVCHRRADARFDNFISHPFGGAPQWFDKERRRLLYKLNKKKWDDYRNKHREQIRARQKQYRLNHLTEWRERYRKYYSEHREEQRERQRKYRIENRNHIREVYRVYCQKHKERLLINRRKYYQDNKEMFNEKLRQYRAVHGRKKKGDIQQCTH